MMESPIVFLLVFSLFWKSSQEAVRCYHCEPEGTNNSCQYFDGSERFIVDCPDSTVCLKKVVALNMLNDVNVAGITRRSCAPQILKGDHIKVNTSWVPVKRIYEERYSGKCEDDTQEGRATRTLICSCRGDLCNRSARMAGFRLVTFGLTVFMMLGAICR